MGLKNGLVSFLIFVSKMKQGRFCSLCPHFVACVCLLLFPDCFKNETSRQPSSRKSISSILLMQMLFPLPGAVLA
ncbi:MAG: hypothetical protein KFF46_08690, partial [Desulfobacterales bacterium]|nr:hypothetical protein [Desulfobacterales bacterium]